MPSIRVLVVDDDEIVREAMCELLRARGCEVFDAGSPIGVTKLIVRNQIDILILDVMMPDISGDKLAKLLRSNPKLQHLTIVLVSSGKLEDLSQLAADVSADSVASKAEIHQRLAEVALTAHQRRVSLRPRKRTEQ